jgi:hypothetical protein
VWRWLAAGFAAVAGLGGWKAYLRYQEFQALQDFMKAAPLRMPEAPSEPAREPPGILPDKEERADMRLTGGRTGDPARMLRELEDAQSVLPVLQKYGDDPKVRALAEDLRTDPRFKAMLDQFRRDRDIGKLMRGMSEGGGIQDLLQRYLNDPHFQKLMREASQDPALRGLNLKDAGLLPAGDEGRASGEAVVDPQAMQVEPARAKATPAPPPPGGPN